MQEFYNIDEHQAAYESGVKDLRNWFLAYGVGGPVLVISNEDIYLEIAESGHASCIIFAFGLGVLAQIIIAFINKWCNYVISARYVKEKKPVEQTKCVQFCCSVSEMFFIDIALDVLSILFLGYATIRILIILL